MKRRVPEHVVVEGKTTTTTATGSRTSTKKKRKPMEQESPKDQTKDQPVANNGVLRELQVETCVEPGVKKAKKKPRGMEEGDLRRLVLGR